MQKTSQALETKLSFSKSREAEGLRWRLQAAWQPQSELKELDELELELESEPSEPASNWPDWGGSAGLDSAFRLRPGSGPVFGLVLLLGRAFLCALALALGFAFAASAGRRPAPLLRRPALGLSKALEQGSLPA